MSWQLSTLRSGRMSYRVAHPTGPVAIVAPKIFYGEKPVWRIGRIWTNILGERWEAIYGPNEACCWSKVE